MKLKRHTIAIKRPSTTTDNRGRRTGSDTTVISDLPASIELLSGLELIRARKQYARADYRVTIWAIDSRIKPTDFLTWTDRYDEERTLHIGHVGDEDDRGMELVLLCSEEVP